MGPIVSVEDYGTQPR